MIFFIYMNIALIIAGGLGLRMNQVIPKQFFNIEDKPVIIYTLEVFQKHPEIHEIAVVCLEGWHDILRTYAERFNIKKLKIVVNGGKTGQQSIRNGILELEKNHSLEDLVLIHDAIRPMVSDEIISDSVEKCRLYGSAAAVIPCAEAMLVTDDRIKANKTIERDRLVRTQTPQTFPLGKLLWAHQEAEKRSITNSIASCSLMVELGETIYFSLGSEKNIKLTTTDDIEIFKALLYQTKNTYIK
jgi:2-C-methyl-D-erythritol 4-phosphate cytidylyltransferase